MNQAVLPESQSGRVKLLAATPPAWVELVLQQFDRFLLDHASAERKASAMAVSFVVQYPDKYELHTPLIRLAREELLHYQQVMKIIQERGLIWERDEKDPYIRQLLDRLSTDRSTRLLDRLLLGGVVEARGVERFGLVGQHHPEPEMRSFYARLSKSEAGHADLFPDLAAHYFEADEIAQRLQLWLQWEAEAMDQLELRPVLH